MRIWPLDQISNAPRLFRTDLLMIWLNNAITNTMTSTSVCYLPHVWSTYRQVSASLWAQAYLCQHQTMESKTSLSRVEYSSIERLVMYCDKSSWFVIIHTPARLCSSSCLQHTHRSFNTQVAPTTAILQNWKNFLHVADAVAIWKGFRKACVCIDGYWCRGISDCISGVSRGLEWD